MDRTVCSHLLYILCVLQLVKMDRTVCRHLLYILYVLQLVKIDRTVCSHLLYILYVLPFTVYLAVAFQIKLNNKQNIIAGNSKMKKMFPSELTFS
jgi:hypothetical protein